MKCFKNPHVLVIVILALLLCSFAKMANSDEIALYISPDGKDTNNGSEARPLATIDAARLKVRELKKKQAGPIEVILGKGTYYLDVPVVFTAEDSGTAQAPITYRAETGAEVVISGGRRLKLKWKPYKDATMQADLSAIASAQQNAGEGFEIDQLFVNGQRQALARYPNAPGRVKSLVGHPRTKTWKRPEGGFIHSIGAWGSSHWVITGRDDKGNITKQGGWGHKRTYHGGYAEGVFEELDIPGEWYYDKKAHVLYYIPEPDIDLSRACIEVPVIETLLEFSGTEKNPVCFVHLQGLTLTHTNRTFKKTTDPLLRSDWKIYRGGTVLFNGAEDCQARDLFLDQVGGNGIFVNNYNRRITITGCKIADAGASSISLVGDPNAVRISLTTPLRGAGRAGPPAQSLSFENMDKGKGPKTNNYPADCLVHDNLLYRFGRFEKQTAGVNISMAMDITVSHNSIYDCPRAGINICDGNWGGHIIEYNDVFDTVKETSDHGAFNSWGRDRYHRLGSQNQADYSLFAKYPDMPKWDTFKTIILRYNRWRCDHGWDIDLDDGSANYHIHNNLCLNGGIKNREGFFRIVENNIMVNNSFHPHVWFHNSSDIFRRNIVFTPYYPRRMFPDEPWGRQIDYNLYHSPGRSGPAVELQQASKRDEHSVYGDAVFVDPANGDYRVKAGSVALELGFHNFDMNSFGVVKPELRAQARTPRLPQIERGVAFQTPDSMKHPWLGATVKTLVGLGDRSAWGMELDMKETGVLFLQVPQDSPAGKAGLRRGDVLLSIDGKNINSYDELVEVYGKISQGREVELRIFRRRSETRLKIHK